MPKLFLNYPQYNSKTVASFNINAPEEMNTLPSFFRYNSNIKKNNKLHY